MSDTQRRRSTPKPKYWILDVTERQSFGRVVNLGWETPRGIEEAVMIRAARMQHTLAIQVRRYAAGRQTDSEDDWSLPALSNRLQTLNYDGLMRVLRGDVHMTLLHVTDLSLVLERDLLRLSPRVDQSSPGQ